jgi:hypothetical protein
MSYAMHNPRSDAWAELAERHYRGYGLGAARACAANATYDADSDVCNCNVGFDVPEGADPGVTPCAAVTPGLPCTNATQARSPVTGHCACPPGTAMSDPASDNCLPVNLFPGCKDASGQTVPGCLSATVSADMLPAIAGIALGALVTWMVFR